MEARPELERLAAAVREADLDALLVLGSSAKEPDLAALLGPVHVHQSFVVARPDGRMHLGFLSPMEREEAEETGLELLTPERLQVRKYTKEETEEGMALAAIVDRGLAELGLGGPARLGVSGRPPLGEAWMVLEHLREEGWEIAPAGALLRSWRRRKSEWMVREVRRVADGARDALTRVAEMLAAAVPRKGELWLEEERLTVGRLRRAISRELAETGLSQPEGNIVAPGREGAVPHNAGRDPSVLRPGSSLIVDLYPRDALFADTTRTFCVGEPPTPLREAYEAVREALALAHRNLREEVSGWELQKRVCEYFVGEGYRTPVSHPGAVSGYVHGLGHGVGFELHEIPSFKENAGEEGMLRRGDLLTLEPGLYDPEEGFGVRLEDLVHLGPRGPELLTSMPYDLDPRAWLDQRPGSAGSEPTN
ncbi:MAG: M24 family metallopeptidase [Thermoanaerobaculia bacterium]|nr:M24 family metallopeptidase [Thermoanaerobaculia bacterium]